MYTDDEIRKINEDERFLKIQSISKCFTWRATSGGMILDPDNPLHVTQVQMNLVDVLQDFQEAFFKLLPFMTNPETMSGHAFSTFWDHVIHYGNKANDLVGWLSQVGGPEDPLAVQRNKLKEMETPKDGTT